MSFQYNYSLSADFTGGNLNEEQLRYELYQDPGFTGIVVIDVGRSGDNVRVVVDTNLSAPQIAVLDATIAAHIAIDETIGSKTLTSVLPRTNKFNNTTYQRCGSMGYEGTIKAPRISSFQIVSYMDVGVTSYSFRVYDIVNKNEIAVGTFTNTAETDCVLSTINNLPYKKATLEFQILKTGGSSSKNVYLDSITVFGNF